MTAILEYTHIGNVLRFESKDFYSGDYIFFLLHSLSGFTGNHLVVGVNAKIVPFVELFPSPEWEKWGDLHERASKSRA